jgi:uncharacterized membrane protein
VTGALGWAAERAFLYVPVVVLVAVVVRHELQARRDRARRIARLREPNLVDLAPRATRLRRPVPPAVDHHRGDAA